MDTTVILAQPRVSRLRADAVYVQNRRCGERVTGSRFFKCNSWRGDPLFLAYGWGNLAKKETYPTARFFAQNLLLLYIEIIPYREMGSRLL